MNDKTKACKVCGLYKAIKDVKDLPTRRILYIQFIAKYCPEAYEFLTGTTIKW